MADTNAVPPQPTSVEEARKNIARALHLELLTEGHKGKTDEAILAYGAAVRVEEREKVNRLRTAAETLVRTWSRYPQNEHESLAMHELRESLAGLAKMEGP